MALPHENLQSVRLTALLKKWMPFFGNLRKPYFPVDPFSFEVKWNSKMRSRAGLCRISQGLIELNPHLLIEDYVLEEVLVHEMCHLVIGRRWPRAQAHGEKWKGLMKICGFPP